MWLHLESADGCGSMVHVICKGIKWYLAVPGLALATASPDAPPSTVAFFSVSLLETERLASLPWFYQSFSYPALAACLWVGLAMGRSWGRWGGGGSTLLDKR